MRPCARYHVLYAYSGRLILPPLNLKPCPLLGTLQIREIPWKHPPRLVGRTRPSTRYTLDGGPNVLYTKPTEGRKSGHLLKSTLGKASLSKHIVCAALLANAANGTLLLRRTFPNALYAYPLSPFPTDSLPDVCLVPKSRRSLCKRGYGKGLRSPLVGIYRVRRRRHRHVLVVKRAWRVRNFRSKSHRVDHFASVDFGIE